MPEAKRTPYLGAQLPAAEGLLLHAIPHGLQDGDYQREQYIWIHDSISLESECFAVC